MSILKPWHACRPGWILAPTAGAPFSLGSAPSSCICRQLYLDVGTNTFLLGYELQLTEEAYRHQRALTLKSLLDPMLVQSQDLTQNQQLAAEVLSSPQLTSMICDVWLLLIIFPELLPAQRIHGNAFSGDRTFLLSNKHDLLCIWTSFERS